mmetsp:Transcript_4519/g.4993  ORF Transcript_4519/g.4993 Transcript_4519/m.4993 type:complete len:102 (-) Transcript_4519:126-431(-)
MSNLTTSGCCGFPGCAERANGGVPPCDFCCKRHCLKHILPEVHGCRDAAKNAARMQASRDATSVREAKRAHDTQDLRAKLQAKREELASQREKKKKPSTSS